MSVNITIDEGYTYDYLAHGLGTIFLLAIIGAIFSGLIIVLGFIIGISLMALKTGVEIDATNRNIRRYFSIFGLKWGGWKDLSRVVLAKMIYKNERGSKESVSSMIALPSMNSNAGPTAVRSYTLSFMDDTENEWVFNEFIEMKFARKTMEALEKHFDFEIQNDIQKMMELMKSQKINRRK